MKVVCFFLACFAWPAPVAQYRHHGPVLLNDTTVTPGKVRTSDAAAICNQPPGWTEAFRKPGIQAVYGLYGVVKKPGAYEIDHLIPLELGGDNGVANEWPQPYEPRPGAHEKDLVENWLHNQVCSGKMALAVAQAEIATDWYDLYLKYQKALEAENDRAYHAELLQ